MDVHLLMTQEHFAVVKQGIASLIQQDVSDLAASGVSAVVRQDGLPQDWVDDVPNLSAEQAAELKQDLEGCEYQWAVSLHGML